MTEMETIRSVVGGGLIIVGTIILEVNTFPKTGTVVCSFGVMLLVGGLYSTLRKLIKH